MKTSLLILVLLISSAASGPTCLCLHKQNEMVVNVTANTNNYFITLNAPMVVGTLLDVYRNGIEQTNMVDYTITRNTVTFKYQVMVGDILKIRFFS